MLKEHAGKDLYFRYCNLTYDEHMVYTDCIYTEYNILNSYKAYKRFIESMRTSEFDSDRTWKIELSSPAEIMANCHLIHTG